MKSFLLFIFLSIILFSGKLSAQEECLMLSYAHPDSSFQVLKDPIKQLFLWQQLMNHVTFTQPTSPTPVFASPVNIKNVQWRSKGFFENSALVHSFFKGKNNGDFLWPHHPLNKGHAPFTHLPRIKFFEAYFSASRTVFTLIDGKLFAVKMPTDHVTYFRGKDTHGKNKLGLSVFVSVKRSEYVKKVDQALGDPQHFKFLFDIESFYKKMTGSYPGATNGFIVRDLTPLQDGNYYFPAFGITSKAGFEIAHLNGESHFDFWNKNYAELFGKVKAEMLLRYGLQMATPNAQNVLIQLSPNLKPTGKLFLWDISDTQYIGTPARSLGLEQELQEEEAWGIRSQAGINLNTKNSFMHFEFSNSYLRKVYGITSRHFIEAMWKWEQSHFTSYRHELIKAFFTTPDGDIEIPKFVKRVGDAIFTQKAKDFFQNRGQTIEQRLKKQEKAK